MDIKIDFDPEKVAEKMHEAILSSTFKEMFSKAATSEFEKITKAEWNRNNVIQKD